jgi:TRAP-type C4-dicarboxylate transport system permease large subunit
MVLVIVAGATMFGHFLAITRIPYALATWVSELAMPNYVVMAFIIFLYLVGGAFIDALALILLTISIFYPVVTAMGYDPIWFGVIIVLVTQMGVITPPVGVNVYIVSGIAKDVPLMSIFRGAVPFLIAIILCSLILIPFPQIALFLPNLMN